MKYTEIQKMDKEKLQKELVSLQEKLQNLRMKNKLGQIKNVRELSQVRKDIARILTFIRAN